MRNLGGLIHARKFAGPAREGKSRTPSMHVDEKSDEAVLPRKRPNKGRQLLAEVVEGRASPKGNGRQAAVVRTLSRASTSIRLAAVRRIARGLTPYGADVRPEGGARCVSSARRDLCGGRGAIPVPTATIGRVEILLPCRVRIFSVASTEASGSATRAFITLLGGGPAVAANLPNCVPFLAYLRADKDRREVRV